MRTLLSATALSALGALAHSTNPLTAQSVRVATHSAIGNCALGSRRFGSWHCGAIGDGAVGSRCFAQTPLSATALSALGALAQSTVGLSATALSALCPDTLWHVAVCPYGPQRCRKMAMEYSAGPSYGLWAVAWDPWLIAYGIFGWLHMALGAQNRVTLIIPAPGRTVQGVLVRAFGRRVATQSRQRGPPSRQSAPLSHLSAPQSRPQGARQPKIAKKKKGSKYAPDRRQTMKCDGFP